ncbi:DUF6542 domain-containing protein [Kitasatospora purpeofusca]|uniref:DUF6542 domain-containing protein n=1 Tax=Kitasatospora purpeofusca TaxID=67352 RepID=UPI002A59A249|nr:DUF6542 domain-containing protein [Kitasatospora purpeofusca]MDY0813683.1 DUF6542 domain-containing protein [Kitasatospora purpeofusca]
MVGQHARGAGGATPPPRPGGTAAVLLAATGLPLAGAVAGELTGNGGGPLFALGAVLGTGIAAARCTRPGRWWVVIAAPPVVLAARAGTAWAAGAEDGQGKALATAAVRWVVDAFPVMAVAVLVALSVVAGRAALTARSARTGPTASTSASRIPSPRPRPIQTPTPTPAAIPTTPTPTPAAVTVDRTADRRRRHG